MTDRYAVFGNPVAHSKSPQIHALFAQQTGQDMQYQAILAPLDGFESSVRDFIAAGGRGANVTVPFKEAAFRLATQCATRANAAGAVNTLMFAEGEIVGDNTDGGGLVSDLRKNLNHHANGKRVLLIGAGGAARGVLLPLLDEYPASLTITNRTPDKAQQLVDEQLVDEQLVNGYADAVATLRCCTFEQLGGHAFDLVINATSAGLDNVALPLPKSIFAPGCLAYEMMYGRDTTFMQLARQNKARVSDGLGMLVEQAAEAFFVWRGVRPDTAPVLQTLRHA